jgi:hypothetical protein
MFHRGGPVQGRLRRDAGRASPETPRQSIPTGPLPRPGQGLKPEVAGNESGEGRVLVN